MRKLYFFIALIGFTLVLTNAAFCAEEVTIKATVDKNKLSQGVAVTLIIEITGTFKENPEIKIPDFKNDFEIATSVQSQSISIKEKEKSQKAIFEYVLIPKKSGKIIISEVEMKYEGRAYETTPIEIEVLPSEPQQETII